LPGVNKSLAKQKLPPIEPLTRKAWDAANSDTDTPAAGTKTTRESRFDRD
jgi:hypothetical protein